MYDYEYNIQDYGLNPIGGRNSTLDPYQAVSIIAINTQTTTSDEYLSITYSSIGPNTTELSTAFYFTNVLISMIALFIFTFI